MSAPITNTLSLNTKDRWILAANTLAIPGNFYWFGKDGDKIALILGTICLSIVVGTILFRRAA